MMKTIGSLLAVSILALDGCSTTAHKTGAAKAESETVSVTYHVRAGEEKEFQWVLARGWETYRRERMVFDKPHVVIRESENGDKARFVEIFSWAKSPDHAPDSVQSVWKEEQSLCEARDGHQGIEGGEVKLVTGK